MMSYLNVTVPVWSEVTQCIAHAEPQRGVLSQHIDLSKDRERLVPRRRRVGVSEKMHKYIVSGL